MKTSHFATLWIDVTLHTATTRKYRENCNTRIGVVEILRSGQRARYCSKCAASLIPGIDI